MFYIIRVGTINDPVNNQYKLFLCLKVVDGTIFEFYLVTVTLNQEVVSQKFKLKHSKKIFHLGIVSIPGQLPR
jgi:hypothetical protein